MLTAQQLQDFREQGYFLLPNLFSEEEIDALTTKIDQFAAIHEAQLQQIGREGISRANEIAFTVHLAEQDPEIMRFVAQEKFAHITSDLLHDTVTLYWDQAVYKKPETPRDFPWHQDTGYTPNLISLILESGQRSGCAPIFQTPPDRFSEVIQYITGHLDQKIIRQDLAALVHLHPSYFDRAFQRDYGVSPMQMVRHLRLRQSLHLLETTNLSLSTIAYACGLGDAGYLSRVFRQHYGQTPGHYRQSIQHSMTDYMPPEQRTAQTTGRAITRE